jgi:hypothetical protein
MSDLGGKETWDWEKTPIQSIVSTALGYIDNTTGSANDLLALEGVDGRSFGVNYANTYEHFLRSEGQSETQAYDSAVDELIWEIENSDADFTPFGGKDALIESLNKATSVVLEEGQGVPYSTSGIPSSVPADYVPGIEEYLSSSQEATDQYTQQAQELWDDYQDFEQQFFADYEASARKYENDLASMPQANLTLPSTLGGGTIALAPRSWSDMYTDQYGARTQGTSAQAGTQYAGMSERGNLAQSIFDANLANLENTLYPIETGLDLYKLQQQIDSALQQTNVANDQSALSTWAPVVGSALGGPIGGALGKVAGGALESVGDFIGGLF